MSGITLDQFRVFAAIVDTGSFAAAARQLNRTQSAVTYAIQKLEEQTGLPLFDRDQYRPTLTTAGKSLLPLARAVLGGLVAYRLHADGFAKGLEPELRLALSQFAPVDPVMAVLRQLHGTFPTVRVGLSTLTMQSTGALDDHSVDMALIPEFIPLGAGYVRQSCGASRIIAVSAPGHPLAAVPGRLTDGEMRAHMQIVTAGRTAPLSGRNYAVQALNHWQTDDLESKLRLIRAGVGWGGLPEHMVAADIASGTLVALDPERWDGLDHMPELNIVLVHPQDRPLGPAGRWLFDRLPAAMTGIARHEHPT